MASLSSINILFRADLTQFSSEMQNVTRQLRRTGAEMQQLGKSLSLSLTLPIVGLGVASVKTFADLEKLQKGLESVMGSSEAAAAEFELLKEVAKLPGLGLEEAVRGSVNLQAAGFSANQARKTLLAFGNALATVGKGARELDLVNLALTQLNNKASGFGGDLRQLTEQLPQLRGAMKAAFGTSNSEEISKLGITGSEVVQRLTAEFAKLPKVTGGINNAFENVSDSLKITLAGIGKEISEAFDLEGLSESISGFLNSFIEKFQALDPVVKKIIIVFAGIAAAIGPVLLGIGALTAALPTLIAGFTVLMGPVGLVIAGISALIALLVYNWEPVKQTLIDTANYFVDLYNESVVFRIAIESVVTTFKLIYNVAKLAIDFIVDGFKNAGRNIVTIFSTIGKLVKAVLQGNISEIPKIYGAAMKQFATDTATSLQAAGKNIDVFVKNSKKDIGEGLENVLLGKRKKIGNVDTSNVKNAVEESVLAGFTAGAKKIKRVKIEDIKVSESAGTTGNTNQAFDDEIAKIKQYIQLVATTPKQIADAKKQIEKLEFQKALALDPLSLIVIPDSTELEKGLQRMLSVARNAVSQARDISKEIGEAFSSSLESFKENLAIGFGEMLGSVIAGSSSLGEIFQGVLSIVADFMVNLGKQLITVGIGAEAFKKATSTLQGGLAIAAGIALIAAGSAFKNIMQKGPAFRDGGIVGGNSYYGDKIMARLDSGEMVTNRKQQKNLWGMINPSVTASDVAVQIMGGFEIDGSKLRLVLDRAEKQTNRTR